MRVVLTIILYVAILGFVVSLANALPFADIIRQILEIHLQAVVGVFVGYGLLHCMGAKKLISAFTSVVLFSGFLAVLQGLHVPYAWEFRDFLQGMQTYDHDNVFLSERMRPMGISFTPVHLGTQILLAFAVCYIFMTCRRKTDEPLGRVNLPVVMVFVIVLLIAIISGNRSPILGMLAFLAAAAFFYSPVFSILGLMLFMPAAALLYIDSDAIFNFLSGTEIRAFRMSDKSSVARVVLRDYGWMLFMNRPFGYGLIFSSTDYVSLFWDQLADYENSQTLWHTPTHNYYLNVLHKYGILIVLPGLLATRILLRNRVVLLGFLPYMVHIFFHNDGPLQGDFLIWYFVPMIAASVSTKGNSSKYGA
ncbi:MAG: O-antigen ligase family protein [Alphaproteobacteria bacterium]